MASSRKQDPADIERLRKQGYRLLPAQVPRPPQSILYVDKLRWCVSVIDPLEQDDLLEAATLLATAMREDGGLLPEEGDRAKELFDRTKEAWARSALTFQRPIDLTNVTPLVSKPQFAEAAQPDLFDVRADLRHA